MATEIVSIPENGGNAGMGNIPFSIPIGGNGGGILGGNNTIGELITLAIVASIFGIGNGNGIGLGNNNGGAAFLSNQIANDAGRDLIMQAVTNQGETSRTAIASLSTMLGQDFNLVNASIMNIQNALNTIASNQGMNALQVINAIQAGDANLAAQFQNCCCQNQLAMCQQTNTLQQSINGVGQQVASKAAADQLAMCQQTYALTETMNRNYQLLDNKIDAMESARKDREITALTAKVAELESQRYTASVAQQSVAPVIGQLNALAQEVAAIKRCQPPVKTVVDNSQTIVPTIWANAVADLVVDRVAAALGTTTGGTTTPTT